MSNTYSRKSTESVQAIRFTGNNVKTVQTFCGERYMDRLGKYPLPRFDDAANWLQTVEVDAPAVLWRDAANSWVLVPINSWVVKDGEDFRVLLNEDFVAEFEVPVEPVV